jgi:predicted dehydrogenase
MRNSLTTLAGMGLHSALYANRGRTAANDKVVVALIGCRNMGYGDLADFLRFPGVECAVLCDIDSQILENRVADVKDVTGKKPKTYKDFRKVIENKDIDVVIVGTPDHWHCLPLVYACQAGKDVYIEKPLSNSIAESYVMLQAARKYKRVVQVGQQQRSGQHWQDAINFVKSGKLGKVRVAKCWANFDYAAGRRAVPDEPVPEGIDFNMWLGPAPDRTFNRARFHGSWRMFWDYGGGLATDWGVHLLDMALWALNIDYAPKSTLASGGIYASKGNAVETADTQEVLYEFDDFSLRWEHNAGIESGPNGRNYGVCFMGSNGTLWADRANWEVLPENDREKARMEAVEPQQTDEKSHINHVENFIECIKTREKPAADIEIGYWAALYAHLGNIAYRTGNKIIWDNEKQTFGDDSGANALVTPAYRAPWKLPEV